MNSYDDNKHLPMDEWIQTLRDALKEDFDQAANTKEGHFYNHVANTDKEMLTNLILGTKTFDAVFTDAKHAVNWTRQILSARAPVIANWLAADKRYFKSHEEYKNLHISIKFTNVEAVGRGYNKDLAEKATKNIDVFLRRDRTGQSPFGFYLETSFPNINHEQAWETGKYYTKDEVIQGGYVPFTNEYEKIAFKFQNEYEDVTIRACTDMSGEPQVKISFEDTYGNYIVYLGDDYLKCAHFSDQGRTYPELNAIPKEYQNFVHEVREYQRYLEHMPMEDIVQDLNTYGGPIQSDVMVAEQLTHNENDNILL